MRMNRHLIAAILAVLAFSTIGLFVKILSPDFTIPLITFARAFFGLLFVALIIPRIEKKAFQLTKKELPGVVIVGFCLAATMTLYNYALAIAPLADVVLLNYTHVFLAPILAFFILKERMGHDAWIILLTGFLGLAIINPFDGYSVEGNILALGAGVSYAIMAVFMRREDKHHELGDVVWFLGFACLFLLPFAFSQPFTLTLEGVVIMALSGIISTGLGYLFFNYALEGLRVHVVSIFDLVLGTLIGVVLSVFTFHEDLHWNVLLGGLIVVGSGILFIRNRHLVNLGLKRPLPLKGIYGTTFLQAKARRAR
jgi:drug/metabolite transporter (DMT)-like permease